MRDVEHEYPSLEDPSALERFFIEAGTRARGARWQGVAFETNTVRRAALVVAVALAALLLAYAFPRHDYVVMAVILAFLVFATYDQWRNIRRGVHVRVWLPCPLVTDLRLESRSPAVQADDPLEAAFAWSATDERALRKYLGSGLGEALIGLAETYRVLMTDRYLQYGPLRGNSTQAADALASLVAALPRPVLGRAPALPPGVDWPNVEEDGSEPVVAAVTSSREEADRWEAVLVAAEVPHLCVGREESPPWGAATPQIGIQFVVPASQVQQARAVLERAESTEQGSFCHLCGASLPDDDASCPECGGAPSDPVRAGTGT